MPGGVRVLIVALLASGLLTGCAVQDVRTEPELGLAATPASRTALATGTAGARVPDFDPAPLLETSPRSLDLFDGEAAMVYVRHLADTIGVREAGGEGEREAADYVAGLLRSWGYEPQLVDVPLPGGGATVNVIAERTGDSSSRFVLGAHLDTKAPSPGANDNATGVAVVLEVARLLADRDSVATIEFAFFGSEERVGDDPDVHHLGSRARVAEMSVAEREATVGMISVDMIGYGPALHVWTMRRGPQTLSDALLAYASDRGIAATFRGDPGSSGWSDHEAYELAGVPAAWVEWRDDPVYHTAADTASHVQVDRVDIAGELVWGYVSTLDEEMLGSLRPT